MGFFSMTCCKTNLPVLADVNGPQFSHLSEVVVLFPDGGHVRGMYDGYGRVGNLSLMDNGCFDDLKFILASRYDGESYEDLPRSFSDPAQGFFISPDWVDARFREGGFCSAAAYSIALAIRCEFDDETPGCATTGTATRLSNGKTTVFRFQVVNELDIVYHGGDWHTGVVFDEAFGDAALLSEIEKEFICVAINEGQETSGSMDDDLEGEEYAFSFCLDLDPAIAVISGEPEGPHQYHSLNAMAKQSALPLMAFAQACHDDPARLEQAMSSGIYLVEKSPMDFLGLRAEKF